MKNLILKNNFPVFGIVTVVLVVFRILLNDNTQLVLVVSSINLVALLVVIFTITNQTKAKIVEKVAQSGVPENIRIRENKHLCRCVDCWTYVPLTIIYIGYLFYFSSELGNDIISIVALGLSLSDSFIADAVANLCVKE